MDTDHTNMTQKQDQQPTNNPMNHTHIYLLLDRSGSMSRIADDVIGGFNDFLTRQQAEGPDARITLVQFDSQDAHCVLLNGTPIAEAKPLSRNTYQPRGGTPLLDATARLIHLGTQAETLRRNADLPTEQVVFVSITDGEENESREFTLEQVRDVITEREAAGWTFVFLSAALDAYGDAHRLGLRHGSTQAFSPDGDGTALAMNSLSVKMSERRAAYREGHFDRATDFFGTDKPAEQDRAQKEKK